MRLERRARQLSGLRVAMYSLAAGLLIAATLTTCAPVNAQERSAPGYSRAQFGGWIDADGDGCRDDAPITDRYTGQPVGDGSANQSRER